jgi:hypothetical protein
VGWTGFQSIQNDAGYIIVYREWNTRPASELKLWGLANKRVRLELVAGNGADFEETAGARDTMTFGLPVPFSFALYRYCVVS